jgi:hypothetical protein
LGIHSPTQIDSTHIAPAAIWLLRILYDNHKVFASKVPTP